MVSKEKIEELKQILKEDYGKKFKQNELVEIANSFVGYFSLLAEINDRELSKNNNYVQNKNQKS